MTEQITNIPDKGIKKNSHCRRRIWRVKDCTQTEKTTLPSCVIG